MIRDVAWWGSAAGFGQPDDVEAFARCQQGLQVSAAEWVLFNRALGREVEGPDGELLAEGGSELTQRAIYREWKRLMRDYLEP